MLKHHEYNDVLKIFTKLHIHFIDLEPRILYEFFKQNDKALQKSIDA